MLIKSCIPTCMHRSFEIGPLRPPTACGTANQIALRSRSVCLVVLIPYLLTLTTTMRSI